MQTAYKFTIAKNITNETQFKHILRNELFVILILKKISETKLYEIISSENTGR